MRRNKLLERKEIEDLSKEPLSPPPHTRAFNGISLPSAPGWDMGA